MVEETKKEEVVEKKKKVVSELNRVFPAGKNDIEIANSGSVSEDLKVISFDAYFEVLKKKNPNISDHHKAAVLEFVKKYSGETNTKEAFDKILERY